MSSIWSVRRSTADAKLAGVCGGAAEHWRVDPTLVRVGAVLLALSGGVGLVLYLAGWLFLPPAGSDRSVAQDTFGDQVTRWPREMIIALVVVASIMAFAALGWMSPFGFAPVIVLAFLWYFGYYKNRDRRPPRQQPTPSLGGARDDPPLISYPGPATPFTQAAEAWQRRVAETQSGVAATPPAAPRSGEAGLGETRPPRVAETQPGMVETSSEAMWPTRDFSRAADSAAHAVREPVRPEPEVDSYFRHPDPVGLYGPEPLPTTTEPAGVVRLSRSGSRAARRVRLVGLLAVAVAFAGLVAAHLVLGVVIPLTVYVAVPLALLGLTLVLGTWFGRARGVLPLAILAFIALLLVVSVQRVGTVDGWGSRSLSYASASQLPPGGDTLDLGTLSVDLSGLDLTRDTTYRARVDAGAVVVTVPADTNIAVTYRLDSGVFVAYGQEVRGGTDLSGALAPAPHLRGRPTLTLDLSVDLGRIEVQR